MSLAEYDRAIHAGDFSVFAFSYICMPYALINSTCMLCDDLGSVEAAYLSAFRSVSALTVLGTARQQLALFPNGPSFTTQCDFIFTYTPEPHVHRTGLIFVTSCFDCLTLTTKSSLE